MRPISAIAYAAILTVAVTQAKAEVPSAVQILGSVSSAARPVASALVIALDVATFEAFQTYSGADGKFSLPKLRGGVYKLIAVKAGFVPAIATLVPTSPDHRVNLKLQPEKDARRRGANQEIWEIRGSLPKDILRELDAAMDTAPTVVAYEMPRLRGQMESMTGVTQQAKNPAFAQTALGVQSRIGENWQLGFRGNMKRIENTLDDSAFGAPLAQSKTMSMELRSSPTDSYRVASVMSKWRYAKDIAPGDSEVDIEAHDFEWERGPARVQVHYFAQENLFRTSPYASDRIEIAGDKQIVQTRRNDVGVAVRVTQETLHNLGERLRTADVSANGSFEIVPALMMHYGMAGRFAVDGREVAPSGGAEWKITKNTSLVGSAMVKVMNEQNAIALPRTVLWSDERHVLPRYGYSFGIVSGKDANNRLSAIVSMTAIDSPLHIVLTDGMDQFWDGLHVDTGDIRRDVRLAYRRELGRYLAVDMSTTAGTATPRDSLHGEGQKVYVAGDFQSTFTPTGTTLAVSYRELQQPSYVREDDYRSERVNVRMAQSLYLPIDMKLLLGVEMVQAENSPYLMDISTPDGTTRKYIGGLAVNF